MKADPPVTKIDTTPDLGDMKIGQIAMRAGLATDHALPQDTEAVLPLRESIQCVALLQPREAIQFVALLLQVVIIQCVARIHLFALIQCVALLLLQAPAIKNFVFPNPSTIFP
jgi:hypothetical protein